MTTAIPQNKFLSIKDKLKSFFSNKVNIVFGGFIVILISIYLCGRISNNFCSNKIFDNCILNENDISEKQTSFQLSIPLKTDNLKKITIPIKSSNLNAEYVVLNANNTSFQTKTIKHNNELFIEIYISKFEKKQLEHSFFCTISSSTPFSIFFDSSSIPQNKQYGYSKKIETTLFIVLFIIFCIYVGGIFFLIKRGITLHNLYLFVAITFGLILPFILGPFIQPDSVTHYESIYRFSNMILGIDDSNYVTYKRTCDLNLLSGLYDENYYPVDHTIIKSPESFLLHMVKNFSFNPDTTLVQTPIYKTIVSPRIEYLPQTILMSLIRLLGGNQFVMYFVMLFGNYCLSIALIYFSIKKLKHCDYFKYTFFIISLSFPILYILFSVSYDSILLSLSFLAVANTLYNFFTKKLTQKDYFSSIIIALLLFPIKSVYFPLSILLLLSLYFKSFPNIPILKKIYYLIAFIIISFILFLIFIFSIDIGLFTNSLVYSLKNLLSQPFSSLNILLSSIFYGTDWFSIYTSLYLELDNSNLFQFLSNFLLLFPVFYGTKHILEKYQMSLILLTYFVMFIILFLVSFSWTNITFIELWGLQSRYFFPISILLYVFLQSISSIKIKLSEKNLLYIVFFINLCNILSRVL